MRGTQQRQHEDVHMHGDTPTCPLDNMWAGKLGDELRGMEWAVGEANSGETTACAYQPAYFVAVKPCARECMCAL